MTAVVVPFRAGKSRLELPEEERRAISLAMLEAVLAAARSVGRTIVVTGDADAHSLAARIGAEVLPDPGEGQGATVAAALRAVASTPVIVVNADLPLATAADLAALADAAPALVAARDGTTNALAFPDPTWYRPLYGPGSARRFAALGLRAVDLPTLAEDVDTLADLERVRLTVEALA